MGSLSECFDTRLTRRFEKTEGAVDLECDKINLGEEKGVLFLKPAKNDWVCLLCNNAVNRRGGTHCRNCGNAHKETLKKLKELMKKEKEEKKKKKKKREVGEEEEEEEPAGSFSQPSEAEDGEERSLMLKKKLAEAPTWEDVCKKQLKKRLPFASFCFFVVFVYVFVPLCVGFFGVICSLPLAAIEHWPKDQAFFFVVGEIVKSPLNLNNNSEYPETKLGVCLSVLLSIWSYLLIMTTVALLSDLEIITFWSIKVENILFDLFGVTLLSNSEQRARKLGERKSCCSFKVGEFLGLVCFVIVVAPFSLVFVGSLATLLLFETEGISYDRGFVLTLRGLSLGRSYDEPISKLDSTASLVFVLYLGCTAMALATLFVGFIFKSHFKKSWLPALLEKRRQAAAIAVIDEEKKSPLAAAKN